MNIGDETPSTTRVRTPDFIPFAEKQITINRFDAAFNIVVYFYDVNNVCLVSTYLMNKNQYITDYPQTFNVPPPTKFIKIDIGRIDGAEITPDSLSGEEFKVEKGNIATSWSPSDKDVKANIYAAIIAATYWSVKVTSPVIYKDAINAATSGTHTPVTVSGELRSGLTTTPGGFLTIIPNGGTEAAAAIASPVAITPSNADGKTSYTVKLYNDPAKTKLLDTLTLPVVFKGASGINSINIVLSNEADVLPADSAGTATDYTDSGTTVRVFEGATELDYDGIGTANGKYNVTASGVNITVGSKTENGLQCVFGNTSAMTADKAVVNFVISGKTLAGDAFSLTKVQSLTKSKTGEKGDTVISGYLTNDNNPLPASNAGVVTDFSKAIGRFKMFNGKEDVTPYANFSATQKNCTGAITESQELVSDWTDGVVQGHFDATDSRLTEMSGLTAAFRKGNEDYLWAMSDSPANVIVAIRKSDASVAGYWSLTGTPSKVDWEDVQSCVIDGVPYLYVFDFGNNPNTANSRGAGIDMVIHRIVEPLITGQDGVTSDYISIPCSFGGNIPTHRDCEAAIIDPINGFIHIITKRITTPLLFSLFHANTYTGIQALAYFGEIWPIPSVKTYPLAGVTDPLTVVSATINKQGTEIILKNYSTAYLFKRENALWGIGNMLSNEPTIIQGYVGGGYTQPYSSHPSQEPQGEGITFDENGIHLYSNSEYQETQGSAIGRFPLFKYSRISGTPVEVYMQDGTDPMSAIYTGTKDTYIWDTNPNTNYGTATTFVLDRATGIETDRRKGLLKFDLTQSYIPIGAKIVGARLDLNIMAEGQGWVMYKMLTQWDETSTYNTLGGVANDGIKAAIEPDCVNGINLDTYLGHVINNIPISTVQGWIDNPSSNNGWMFDGLDVAGDGVQFSSREDAIIANRPRLTIRYTNPEDEAGFYKVTAIPSTVDNAELKLTGTFDGISIEKIFSISKSKIGATGTQGPSSPYQGQYDPDTTYYGSTVRTDVVKHVVSGIPTWYIALPTHNTFSGHLPTDTAYWRPFGTNYESIATAMLLADGANLAGFIFKTDGVSDLLISQKGTINGVASVDYNNLLFIPNLTLNGTTGVIKAGTGGEIGLFKIYDKSLSCDNIEFANEDVETLASLSVQVIATITDTGGTWLKTITGGKATGYTIPIALTQPSKLKFYTQLSTAENYLEWEIKINDSSGNQVYFKNRVESGSAGGTTKTVLTDVILPTGSYVISASASSILNDYNSVSIYGFETANTIKAISYTARTKIGKNGFYSFWDALKYFYYHAIDGLKYRGAIDIPAGLGGASINSAGTVGSYWGKMIIAGNGVSKNGNVYTITHYIGDTNYSIVMSPISANMPYFTSKTANTIIVTCAGGFDFILIRTQ